MLADQPSFIRQFLREPRRTGAVLPATRGLARCVGRATWAEYSRIVCGDRASNAALQVLELGAGMGALTGSICGLDPVLVERDDAWANVLRQRFPALRVRTECATETLRQLTQSTALVCSIPLLNNPESTDLRKLVVENYQRGLIEFCVLYTYGWSSPLPRAAFASARRTGFVLMNLPPASVWVYS
jgi:phosphatidylethanolamine/phosphatidyl-N-methylethanolamine N-methyltransferase